MACGENAKNVYGKWGRDFGPFSRMGEAWYFRHAFEQASAMVVAQDDWCATADQLGAENMGSYLPRELKWESLGALLRGQVQLNVHCYTVPDLEAFVRHTNEWKFKVRAFHHAHQTYLVPEILKRAFGGRPPAAALFADNMYYKAEAYIASEHAGNILYKNGITPVYVSDNPVLNAQHVVFEAAKAYKNGLPYHVALAGVTSASAELLGLGSRIGKIKPGFDADVVVWDSDPLSIGAAPVQVWIDGTPQFDEPVELDKPTGPPLQPNLKLQDIERTASHYEDVIFTGISKVMLPGHEVSLDEAAANVVVQNGLITCIGACEQEILATQKTDVKNVPLRNGYIAPTLTAFGSSLGLVEIPAESSTQDGANSDETISRAVDGLALDTKNLHAAYTHGVTRAITSPQYKHGGFKGVSVGFSTRPQDAYKSSAVWQDEVALHYPIEKTEKMPSLSGSFGLLKEKLLKATTSNATDFHGEERYFKEVVEGEKALALTVHSADLITSLLRVKTEVEQASQAVAQNKPQAMRWIFIGGAESHLVAGAIAEADVGVVLAPLLAYSESWDQRRSLVGAPLTNGTTIDVLHAAGVKVAIGTKEDWETRNLFLSAGIAYANGGGRITEKDALAFVSTNVYDMLGLKIGTKQVLDEFMVFEGSPLEIDGHMVAVADGRGQLDLWT